MDIDLDHRLRACRRTPLIQPNNFTLDVEHHKCGQLDITVVRDDILCGGTKSRVLYPYLIESGLADKYNEFVYVSPWYGGAQIALAWTCALLTQERKKPYQAILFIEAPPGLETTIFDGASSDVNDPRIPSYTKVALSYGAKVVFVPQGSEYLRAKRYCKIKKAHLLPPGFNVPYVVDVISILGQEIISRYGYFDECWAAVGSGALISGLQKSNLAKEYYGVCVFQTCPDIGKAVPIIPEISFKQTYTWDTFPPFPSTLRYDAKVWKYLQERSLEKKRVLFWNVM